MNKMSGLITAVLAAAVASPVLANEGAVPKGVPHYDHVFVIMMENHTYQQVVGNPTFPYLNTLISNNQVNVGTNYYAVGHPSLTNYLEIVGGSNFGVRSDNAPELQDQPADRTAECRYQHAERRGTHTGRHEPGDLSDLGHRHRCDHSRHR
jgi:hypothetical protein